MKILKYSFKIEKLVIRFFNSLTRASMRILNRRKTLGSMPRKKIKRSPMIVYFIIGNLDDSNVDLQRKEC